MGWPIPHSPTAAPEPNVVKNIPSKPDGIAPVWSDVVGRRIGPIVVWIVVVAVMIVVIVAVRFVWRSRRK
jgi:hypothetical protein